MDLHPKSFTQPDQDPTNIHPHPMIYQLINCILLKLISRYDYALKLKFLCRVMDLSYQRRNRHNMIKFTIILPDNFSVLRKAFDRVLSDRDVNFKLFVLSPLHNASRCRTLGGRDSSQYLQILLRICLSLGPSHNGTGKANLPTQPGGLPSHRYSTRGGRNTVGSAHPLGVP